MKTNSFFRAFATAAVAAVGLVFPATAKPQPVSAPVDLRIEFDRPVLPADEAQRAIVKIGLTGCRPERPADRTPVNLVIVLDRSGSMSGDKIAQAREAAVEALRRLDRRDIFSLVIYDHEVSTLISPQAPTDALWLDRQIRGITSRGNTALFAGVSQGAAELRKNLERRGFVHRVLLLSDGQANVGPSSADDLGRLGAALRREGIAVTTVGLGDGFNEDLMAALAQRSDGNHYYVAESGDLPRFEPGELVAVGYVGGAEVARHAVRTPAAPARLETVIDTLGMAPAVGESDVVAVHARVCDTHGTLCVTAEPEVDFAVTGGAEIVGPATVKAEAGIASIVVRVPAGAAEWQVAAKADAGLASA